MFFILGIVLIASLAVGMPIHGFLTVGLILAVWGAEKVWPVEDWTKKED